MSNETKKFAGLGTLQAFLDGCKTLFASITHKHTMSDITDYTVDSELSSESTNPVQNATVNAAFDATKSELREEIANKADASNPVLEGSLGLNHAGELGFSAVSLGFANTASGMYCLAEGMGNKATGDASHAEGTGNTASGMASHAEGSGTQATNVGAHAEGANTKAIGYGSHAEGSNTIASAEGQHVEGRYNIEDTEGNYSHIVGNGTSNSKRSNAHTVDWDGNAWYAGTIKVGGTSFDDASEVALKSDIPTEYTHFILIDSVTGDKYKLEMRNGSLTSSLIEPEKILISFTVGGNEYQAEEGMTWAEFIESDYNDGKFKVEIDDEISYDGQGFDVPGTMNMAMSYYIIVEGDYEYNDQAY